jgi:hypothetical protein
MALDWTPMRWPAAWKSPSNLDLLKGTPIKVIESGAPPAGVTVVKGLWPGIRLSRSGGNSDATAGPTGEPWVNSNGWRVRLAQALHPGEMICVDAVPSGQVPSAASYVAAFADSAAAGGRWIISLDDKLADRIAAHDAKALETWHRLMAGAAFFNAHKNWAAYVPQAVLGIVSDFQTPQSQEVLNLVARTNQQYRVIPASRVTDSSFQDLRAVIYPDAEPPAAEVRETIAAFVRKGGLLIAGPKWGDVPGSTSASSDHPRFTLRTFGKGKVAIAKVNLDDPYLLASDSAMLMSHRYELLRFWNAGAVSSFYSAAPGGQRAVVQIVSYAMRGTDSAAVRIAGPYRTAKLLTIEREEARVVPFEIQDNAIEVHLPAVSQYVAIELAI